jgi:hypothetical protein
MIFFYPILKDFNRNQSMMNFSGRANRYYYYYYICGMPAAG